MTTAIIYFIFESLKANLSHLYILVAYQVVVDKILIKRTDFSLGSNEETGGKNLLIYKLYE